MCGLSNPKGNEIEQSLKINLEDASLTNEGYPCKNESVDKTS